MANTFLQASRIAAMALGLLQREIVLPRLVWRFALSDFRGAKDDTVTLRLPAIATARDYEWRTRTNPIVIDDLTEKPVDIKLDRQPYSAVAITDEQLTLDIVDFAAQVLTPQVRAVAERIEGYIATAMSGAPYKETLTFNALTDEAQTVNLGPASAGTVTINVDGQATGNIAYNADLAAIQAAIDALPNVAPGDVVASGGPFPGTVTLTFAGAFKDRDVAQVVVTPTGLTNGAVTVQTTKAGGQADDDVWRDIVVESRRILNATNVPMADRVLLLGSSLEAAFLGHDKFVKANESGTADALREATLGRLGGFTVVTSNAIPANEGYAYHRSAFAFANVAPAVPAGASAGGQDTPTGAGGTFEGLALRWLRDYDPNYLRDRSVVSAFAGVTSVNDGPLIDADNDAQVDDPSNVRAVKITAV